MQREMMRAREGQSAHRQSNQELLPADFRPGERIDAQGNRGRRISSCQPRALRTVDDRDDCFLFQQRPDDAEDRHFNPLTPERIAERRAAVLDFISAALFTSESNHNPVGNSPSGREAGRSSHRNATQGARP
jgi:hypothetical protein